LYDKLFYAKLFLRQKRIFTPKNAFLRQKMHFLRKFSKKNFLKKIGVKKVFWRKKPFWRKKCGRVKLTKKI